MGIEPTVPLPGQQFSRLPDSATLAPLRLAELDPGRGWIEYIIDIVVAMGYGGAYLGGSEFSIGFLFPRCALVLLDPWS